MCMSSKSVLSLLPLQSLLMLLYRSPSLCHWHARINADVNTLSYMETQAVIQKHERAHFNALISMKVAEKLNLHVIYLVAMQHPVL